MLRSEQAGMGLIEVMVAITVAALLLALGVPSFTTGMQNRQIRTAADAIQNGLQLARTEALRRNRVVRFQLGTETSWTVGCATPDPTIEGGEQICPATIQKREGAEGSQRADVQAVQLDATSGAPAGSPVFAGNLNFTPLGRLTSDTLPGGNVAEYQVSNPGAGTCAADGGEMRCLSIRVTASGQIRMCDPAVSTAGDPRAC
jgi:type IV fimbrial biogenesis protein FimT